MPKFPGTLEQRVNTNLVIQIAAVVATLLAVYVMVSTANRRVDELDQALDDIAQVQTDQQTDRTQARVVSCNSYNADVVDRINGIMLSIVAGSRDQQEARQRVEPLLMPHRDCSDGGIGAYFDGDPATNPFVPVTIP